MGRTDFQSPSARNGPVGGAYVAFVLGPTDLAAGVTTGQRLMGILAPCALRIARVTWANRLSGGAGTTALYQHSVYQTSGATTVMIGTSIATSGGVEGAGFVSSAVRDVPKGNFVFFDPLTTGSQSDIVFTIFAYVQGHAVAAGESAD